MHFLKFAMEEESIAQDSCPFSPLLFTFSIALLSFLKKIFSATAIVGYPMIQSSYILRYQPWAIWLEKSRNHE